jgi:hypothetical protein
MKSVQFGGEQTNPDTNQNESFHAGLEVDDSGHMVPGGSMFVTFWGYMPNFLIDSLTKGPNGEAVLHGKRFDYLKTQYKEATLTLGTNPNGTPFTMTVTDINDNVKSFSNRASFHGTNSIVAPQGPAAA